MVNGEHNHLSNPDNANKIRAFLLAAMRSAVLWSQCGGSRWQIMFKRKVFTTEADKILKENPRTLH
jgi:high frequency lysogenization protein